MGSERLRTTLTPRHTSAHFAELVEAVVDVWRRLGIPLVAPYPRLLVKGCPLCRKIAQRLHSLRQM